MMEFELEIIKERAESDKIEKQQISASNLSFNELNQGKTR